MISATVFFVIAAVLFSALIRGLAGFGFSISAVPLLSLVLPPVEAVVLALLLQLVVGLYDFITLRKEADWPSIKRLIVGAIVGTPIGFFALTALDPNLARIVIAIAVLLGLVLLLTYKPRAPSPNNTLAVVAGAAAGVFSGLAGMPGPPVIAYYIGIGMYPKQTRASLMVFFFFVSAIATPGIVLAGELDLKVAVLVAASVPSLALGTWVGTQVFARLNSGQFRTIAIAVMAISGVIGGWRGVIFYL